MALRGTETSHTQDAVNVGGLVVSGIDANAQLQIPVNTGVTATGSTAADAAQLYPGFTVVTGANGTLGVILPQVPKPGTLVIIKGVTSGVLKVWPDTAATINAISSNGALSLTTGLMPSIFIASSATQWYSIPLVAS